jgi:hypothetical protein
MGRPDILSSFIVEAAGRFPADKYALTLFDHGSGAAGGYVDTGPPGTTLLTVPDLRAGVANGAARSGIGKFDLIFHAACLMSNYEAASALAPLAESIAGSEEIMIQYPVSVDGYTPAVQNRSGAEVGKAFIDGYGRLLDEIATQGGQTYRDLAAMSVVSGPGVQRLDAALESFAAVAVPRMDEIATAVARAREKSLEFQIGYGLESADLVDLGDFLRNLDGLPTDVAVARDAAYAALKSSVTAQVLGRATEQALGLSVFLPTDPRNVGSYLSDGTAPRGWGAFVQAFLEQGVSSSGQGSNQQGASGLGFTSPAAKVLSNNAGGIKIAAQLRQGGAALVTASETQVFAPLGGQPDALVIALPAYVNAGGADQVQGLWSYDVTTISDGRNVVPVSAGYQAQSGGFVGSFSARYTAPDGGTADVGVRVLLSSEGDIESVSLVDVSNGQAAGLELEDGGKLTPYLAVPSSGSLKSVLSNESVRVTEDLAIGFSGLASGTQFEMVLLVADVQGNVAAAGVTRRVP